MYRWNNIPFHLRCG